MPELKGRINGMAVRVPVSDVSMIDLTCRFRENVSYKDICTMLRTQAADAMDGILAYCDEPVVSTDLRGNPHSSIFGGLAGMQTEGGLTKLVAWYDNEWGYACRCLDLAAHISRAN
ncbi:aldehyde dehydrogenase [Mesorhizobium huakuii]|uniref:Aldehyde dehydrogenase n=2 Tax=Mesorhizobium huakuii TaxID=28104 RepID=A0A7G6SNR6_9HYPH|nr:aldehyde dehydrogenase [Mesorhizobium huakuii]